MWTQLQPLTVYSLVHQFMAEIGHHLKKCCLNFLHQTVTTLICATYHLTMYYCLPSNPE